MKKTALQAYFKDLSQDTSGFDYDEFCKNWDRVPARPYNYDELIDILHDVSQILPNIPNAEERNNAVQHVKNNLRGWFGADHTDLEDPNISQVRQALQIILTMDMPPPQVLIAEYAALLKDNNPGNKALNGQDPFENVMALVLFADFRNKPTDNLVDVIEQRALQQMDYMQAEDLAAAMQASVILDLDHQWRYLNALRDRIATLLENDPESFTISDKTSLYWSMAAFDALGNRNFIDLADDLYQSIEQDDLHNDIDNKHYLRAALWFNHKLKDMDHIVPHIHHKRSNMQLNFVKYLANAGLDLQKHQYFRSQTHGLKHVYDATIKMQNEGAKKTIFIDIDSDKESLWQYNFRKSNAAYVGYDGATLFLSKLISKKNPNHTVVRMPYDTVRAIQGSSKNKKSKTLNNVAHIAFNTEEPGVYITLHGRTQASLKPLDQFMHDRLIT